METWELVVADLATDLATDLITDVTDVTDVTDGVADLAVDLVYSLTVAGILHSSVTSVTPSVAHFFCQC
ncbi:hypothetical protein [Limnofasciculus baicalensis]|uniref:Uncharacterized protein n=1 Tax=Limnofasciculus baicalensis BBK-W-15 TaxID=2699891 RepID=A0AAE3KMD8_9CYAN|nr:hypothetical protein [Limnofasciculus baicalensis]MCP2729390.1 hypothetical protein [Limnofasciculus baicalensis BBK-W-15]